VKSKNYFLVKSKTDFPLLVLYHSTDD